VACDAVLALDCASPVPEPYFIYLCPEQDNVALADPAVYERAVGLFAENGRLAHCLAEGAGIPREKIHVIPPAVAARQDLPSIRPPRLRQAPRRRLLLRVSDGCAQHLSSQRLRCVLDALAILRLEHDAQVSLTIFGLGNWPMAGSPPDGVSIRGIVPAGEAIELLDSHDLLVVPPGIEFAGLPEALSRGVPGVAARASEMSEAITPEVTGALVGGEDARELADAVASVLGNDELYRNCYQRAPGMAAYFSWERVARQVAYVISREVGFIALPGTRALSGAVAPGALVKIVGDDPGATRCLNLRVRTANFGKKVGHEKQHDVGCLLDQLPRADDGDPGARHPQPPLRRRRVGHRGQEVVIDFRLAQQRDRTGRRPVACHRAASGALRAEPLVNGLGTAGHVSLKAGHDARIQHPSCCLDVQQAADGVIGAGVVRAGVVAAGGEEHGAAVEVELPRCARAEAHLGQHRD